MPSSVDESRFRSEALRNPYPVHVQLNRYFGFTPLPKRREDLQADSLGLAPRSLLTVPWFGKVAANGRLAIVTPIKTAALARRHISDNRTKVGMRLFNWRIIGASPLIARLTPTLAVADSPVFAEQQRTILGQPS